MIMDLQNLLSDQQNLAQAAASYLSTNSIDLWGTTAVPTIPGLGGSVIKDIGRGSNPGPEMLAQITEAFTSGGAGTLQVQLIEGTGVDGNGQINAGINVLQETQVYALAALTLGKQVPLALPVGITKRYLAMRYVIGTAAMTAGKITAGLVPNRQSSFV